MKGWMGGPGGDAFHLVKRFAYNTVKSFAYNTLKRFRLQHCKNLILIFLSMLVSYIVQCTFIEQVLCAKLLLQPCKKSMLSYYPHVEEFLTLKK
jgi:hypothetical protein